VAERVEPQPVGEQRKARLCELGVRPLDGRKEDPLANVVTVRRLPVRVQNTRSSGWSKGDPALCVASSSRSDAISDRMRELRAEIRGQLES
jgi:hypothetical protein